MNFKKAVIIITAASVLAASFAGCSEQSRAAGGSTDNITETVQQQESTEVTTDTEETAAVSSEESTEVTKAEGKTTATAKADVKTTAAAKQGSTAAKRTSAKTTTKKVSATAKKTTKTTAKNTASNQTTAATQTTATTAASAEIKINLTKNGNAECKSSNVTIDAPSGLETEGTVYIEKGGDYVITSSTDIWRGQIVIQLANTESAKIRIENVNITSQKANVIKILDTNITEQRSFIEADVSSGTAGGDTDNALRDEMKEVSKQNKAPNVDLSFPTGTKSSFTTGANKLSGVIYNESKLTIKGNGAVDISATTNRNNAICSTKSITFKNVTATLTTEANNNTSALSSARGIFTFSKVYVESGTLNIASNGDGIRCEEFNSSGGKTNIVSSACDGIDADDAINITGGTVTVKGLQKSCFKVRRINNQEKIKEGNTTIKQSDGVTKATHTFKIDGGTVVGEGKNITTVQTVSKQASITCRSVKAANSEEAKNAITFTIKGTGVNTTSADKCIKYLYSSSAIDVSKDYTVSSSGYTSQKVSFEGNVGDVRIEANK